MSERVGEEVQMGGGYKWGGVHVGRGTSGEGCE